MASSSIAAARPATIRSLMAPAFGQAPFWSEKFEGTNGIGTCIVEQRAVTIDRDQHFFTRNSGLFCTTAPIFDENGDLAAALDVSSCRA
jgi:transcriptional regulator of acetoin/glycerol metabolism